MCQRRLNVLVVTAKFISKTKFFIHVKYIK
jgi:phosphatidylinositol kinase/protein kinase (PI-3  family)